MMESITYNNIQIDGVPYTRILDMEIEHSANNHASAYVRLEAAYNDIQEFVKRTDERLIVKITTTAAGQPSVLFCGVIDKIDSSLESEYGELILRLKSTSILLDHRKNNKSFQKTSITYEQMLQELVQGYATLSVEVSDRAIGSMIVQCNETNWEFCKRMASRLGVALITTIDKELPMIYVGPPQNYKEYEISPMEGMEVKGVSEVATSSAPIKQGVQVSTLQYMFLGDGAVLSGDSSRVREIHSSLNKGILVTTIVLSPIQSFKQNEIVNTNISGKMYTGTVKKVEKDKVQVHINDIDAFYDEGDVWLPYSTAYSSSDGSGFYCMPAEEDTVRVFFPGTDEGQAFAASSVSVSPGKDVTDKQWTGPKGKQILLTKEGIYITTNNSNSRIFINLTDDDGITIQSDKNITVCAKKNISFISNNTIDIKAENDILISTAESFIDIKPSGIEIGAENVVIK